MASPAKTTANDNFLDDNSILNAVNPTHTPDGRITAIKPLLSVTAKILKDIGITTLDQELLADNTTQAEIEKSIEALTPIINTVFCKLACECSGGDQHGGTMTIFKAVGCYDWDAKAMIVLTAFAMRCGELCLMATTAKTSLAATLTFLKRLPRITENILVLIEAVIKISKCITDVACYSDHISDDNLSLIECKFTFPIAAYWIIRSLVACSSHFTSLPADKLNNRSFTVDTDYVSFLVGGINNVYDRINVKLQDCNREIEEKRRESYLQIKILFEIPQKTNLQILEGIHDSKDPKPLFHCKNGRVTLEEVLKEKTVMLYVSDLSITTKTEDLSMLKTRYIDLCSVKQQSHRRHEIVWLPIIDKFTEATEQTFNELVADMPWYTLIPQSLKPEAKQYIKEKWMYEKKTSSLVAVDKGKVVCHNALHLVRIWKKLDFSFTGEEAETRSRKNSTSPSPVKKQKLDFSFTGEEADSLWRNVSWKLDLFEDHFDAPTKDWVRRNNYICLYGGKDIKWIKEFTKELDRVSNQIIKTQIKPVYIGKHVKEVTNQAQVDNYKVYCWDEAKICSFWEHLESMWHCKMQYQGKTGNNDLIMQELMRMISFGNSEKGWAIFSKGTSSNIVKAHEEELLTCLREWSSDAKTSKEEFLVNLSKRLTLNIQSTDHHCISFVLPRDAANFKEEVICVQCQQEMEKFVLYRCCK